MKITHGNDYNYLIIIYKKTALIGGFFISNQ